MRDNKKYSLFPHKLFTISILMGTSDKNNMREWKISKEARIGTELFINNNTKKNAIELALTESFGNFLRREK